MPTTTAKSAALAVLACLAPALLTAEPAGANTFTVCASGCDFATITAADAAASVHDGDELIVKPGTYTDAPVLTKLLAVHGEPSQPRPVLTPSAFGAGGISLGEGSAGSVVSHLQLEPTDANGTGFYATAPGTLSDLVIHAARTFGIGAPGTTLVDVSATQTSLLGDDATVGGTTLRDVRMSFPNEPIGLTLMALGGGGTVIEDSTFSSPGGNIPLDINGFTEHPGQVTIRRVRVDGGNDGIIVGGPATITDTLATATAGSALDVDSGAVLLRNVTAISAAGAKGFPSFGLRARGCSGSKCSPGVIAARNVIARGLEADVDADAATGSPGAAGEIGIDHSDLRNQAGGVTASAIQSGDPLFANGTVGAGEDFHLRSGSPAIDAGLSDPFTGTTDLGGAPRVQGAAIDLGAYEFTPPPPPPPTVSTAGNATGAPSVGAPPATTAHAPATLTLLAHTVRIDSKRRTGSLSANCSAQTGDQCAVVGSLVPSAGKGKLAAHRKARAPSPLGTLTGTVRGGRQGRLTIRLTRSALASLRTRRSLSVSLSATVTSAGGTTRLSASLRLQLSAPSRKQ